MEKVSITQRGATVGYSARMASKKGSKAIDTKLDPSVPVEGLSGELREKLQAHIINQREAIDALVRAYETFLLGFNPSDRPIRNLIFAGPTGTGKTLAAESLAHALFGDTRALTKIDCEEFQAPHEISKLLGAPAGYIGHKETEAMLSQSRIDRYQTAENPLNIILFDEIEKADPALWNLLLGILDKGRVSLGNGHETDFTRSIIILTTNRGAREMDYILSNKGIGFSTPVQTVSGVNKAATKSIRGNFSPEFVNRIDEIIVFNTLTRDDLRLIFSREVMTIQDRMIRSNKCPLFILRWTTDAIDYLIDRGTDSKSGSRELKRVLEKLVVHPLSALILSKQIQPDDIITVDIENSELVFLHE